MSTERSMTFREATRLYWQKFTLARRVDRIRNEGILQNHIFPRFGDRSLSSLRAEDGLAYVEARRREKASDGTIFREWSVLMAVLNTAVGFDSLDKNRLKAVKPPKGSQRTRVAEDDELASLPEKTTIPEFWRIIVVACMAGLRLSYP